MKPFDPSKLPQIAATELTKLAKLIVSVPSPDPLRPLSFNTRALDSNGAPPDLIEKAKSWVKGKEKHCFIYYIHCDASAPILSKTRTKFSEAKAAEREGRAYAQVNPFQSSGCLYVGGTSNVVLRFKQHLGYGYTGTSALHLSSWACGLRIPLEIVVWRYDLGSYKVGEMENVIGALEDALWEELLPMFGRKGRR